MRSSDDTSVYRRSQSQPTSSCQDEDGKVRERKDFPPMWGQLPTLSRPREAQAKLGGSLAGGASRHRAGVSTVPLLLHALAPALW